MDATEQFYRDESNVPTKFTAHGNEMTDKACICRGNWRTLVKEYEPLIGKHFRDRNGNIFTFFGLVHADDDYYYGMNGATGLQLLSCVGSIEGHSYTLVGDSPSQQRDELLAVANELILRLSEFAPDGDEDTALVIRNASDKIGKILEREHGKKD